MDWYMLILKIVRFRLTIVKIIFFAALFSILIQAYGDTFPSKPIKLIVPFPPGGPADIFARALSEKFTTVFSQPVIIENKAGATGTIGASFVANAVPDGYTLLIGTSNEITMSPSLFKVMPYDPNKAFSPITTIATFPNVLVVNNNFKAKSFQDFLRIARSDPSGLNFASSGVGSTNDLTTLLFSSKTKIKLNRIQYKGGGQAVVDLLGGHVDALFATLPSAILYIQSGQLRALATTGPTRSSALAEIPNFPELGFTDFTVVAWNGVLAPAHTPPEIVQILYKEISKVVLDPQFKAKVISVGADPISISPKKFESIISEDYQMWSSLIKATNISLD